MNRYRRHAYSDLLLGGPLACGLVYWMLFHLPREAFIPLIGGWMCLFVLYGWWIAGPQNAITGQPSRITGIILLGMILRIIATFSVPVLSDDYVRFLWDGQLWHSGTNPFTVLPADLALSPDKMQELGLSMEWFQQLNSKEYFTIYPPVLQGIFWLAAWTGEFGSGILVMKLILLFAEGLSVVFLINILHHLKRPLQHAGWYILNPVVILELCGNLHFEALMITFLLAAIWLLMQKREVWSAVMLGLSVATKLLPLLYLPLLIRRIGCWKSVRYGMICIGVVALLYLPMFSLKMMAGFSESLELYVNRFEFNAGIWYAVRAVGVWIMGWNPIREIGPWLSLLAACLILWMAFREQAPSTGNWAGGMLATLTLYFFLSLIVHPWYITTLVVLAPLTGRTYPIVWSVFLPWTYLAYSVDPVNESMWVIAAEYLVVVLWIFSENKAWFQRVIPSQFTLD